MTSTWAFFYAVFLSFHCQPEFVKGCCVEWAYRGTSDWYETSICNSEQETLKTLLFFSLAHTGASIVFCFHIKHRAVAELTTVPMFSVAFFLHIQISPFRFSLRYSVRSFLSSSQSPEEFSHSPTAQQQTVERTSSRFKLIGIKFITTSCRRNFPRMHGSTLESGTSSPTHSVITYLC